MRKKYLKIKLYSSIKMVKTQSTKSKNVLKAKSKTKTKVKSKKTKTTSAPVVETPPAPVEETTPAPVEETTPVHTEETTVEESSQSSGTSPSTEESTEQEVAFEGLCTMVIDLQQQLKALNTQIKQLQKNYKKEVKELKRKCKKPKKTADPSKKRAPSGFAKPTNLSPELCKFLDVSEDTKLARTQVTKHITAYIKEHNLQNQENKKIILPDDKLKGLLNSGDDEVTYFNLQKFMKVHFIKDEPSSTVVSQ